MSSGNTGRWRCYLLIISIAVIKEAHVYLCFMYANVLFMCCSCVWCTFMYSGHMVPFSGTFGQLFTSRAHQSPIPDGELLKFYSFSILKQKFSFRNVIGELEIVMLTLVVLVDTSQHCYPFFFYGWSDFDRKQKVLRLHVSSFGEEVQYRGLIVQYQPNSA